MRVKDAPVGTIFQFTFESDREWVYTKISFTEIMCIKAPNTMHWSVGTKFEDKKYSDGQWLFDYEIITREVKI